MIIDLYLYYLTKNNMAKTIKSLEKEIARLKKELAEQIKENKKLEEEKEEKD